MKILLAIDGSDDSTKAMSYLLDQPAFNTAGNQCTALTVVLAVPPGVSSFVGKSAVDAYYDEEAEKVLGPAKARLAGLKAGLATAKKVGHPAKEIIDFATAGGFDLILMGCRGHGTVGSLVLGSVTSKVLAGCSVPVLLLR